MLRGLFGSKDATGKDAKPAVAAPVTPAAPATPAPAVAATPPEVAESSAAPSRMRMMRDITVLASGRDIPNHRAVLTDRGQRYTVREDDRRHVALMDLGAGQFGVAWTNQLESKPALDALLHRLKQDNVTVGRFYEASEVVLGLLYRPADMAGSEQRLEIRRTNVSETIDDIIVAALRVNASDIHLQADASSARILFRVHGAIEMFTQIHVDLATALSNALFTMGDKDSKQASFSKNDYQDAAITHTVLFNGKPVQIKLRFASLRTNSGWDVVLRLLDQDSTTLMGDLQTLGYDDIQIFDFNRMLSRPKGLVLLCGPTGSGKTTTNAALLSMLYQRHEGTQIIRTIEDPVEIVVPGLRQHPVVRGEKDENGFLKVFRCSMRGDPDVLFVGEVRDRETAELLQHSVQSGHKVFATLHSSDAFGAVSRLNHLGISRPDLTDDTFISGIVNQTLLRVLCPDCSQPIDRSAPADLVRRLMRLGLEDWKSVRFAGPGCETCRHTKYIGRTVAAEILIPDREVLQHLSRDDRTLARAYWRAGLSVYDKSISGRTALDQAIEKMLRGKVSPIDVEKALDPLDMQRTQEAEKDWYRKAMRSRDHDHGIEERN